GGRRGRSDPARMSRSPPGHPQLSGAGILPSSRLRAARRPARLAGWHCRDADLLPEEARVIHALAVERLSHNFGGLQALSDVSLHATAGERLVIVGPNGAGKTTLFNIVTG